MPEVHQALPGGKGADPPAAEPPALNLGDPSDVRAWLTALREHVADAVSAGEDATRPIDERDLGQRAARRIVHAVDPSLASRSRRHRRVFEAVKTRALPHVTAMEPLTPAPRGL